MKKGFTLAELLGVIILLGAIALIVVPLVSNSMQDSKETLYNDQIKSIELSLASWMSSNQTPAEGETITLSLSQLKEAGLVELDITNPMTEELFPNDMILKITNNNGIIEYEISENGNNKEDYKLIPSIRVNGNVLEYVEVNSENYNDLGVTAKDSSNNVLSDVSVVTSPNLDLTQIGTYLRSYTVTANGYSNIAYRTIIVRDTTGPVIEFPGDLTLNLSQVDSYDFKSDITVTDNSGGAVEVTVTDNIHSLAGSYTVEYRATDASGNVSTKLRRVVVTE